MNDRTMRAAVLDAPGPPEALVVRRLPVPAPAPGEVLIEVRAAGLNRSELHTRLGLAEGVVFPRVLGIEATGVVRLHRDTGSARLRCVDFKGGFVQVILVHQLV